MPSTFDTLIGRVADEQLRTELRAAAAELRKITDFGLVFEAHLPETVRLPHHPIRRGVKVAYRNGTDKSIFEVVSIQEAVATIRRVYDHSGAAIPAREVTEVPDESTVLDSLVAVADFGDPIYPGLRRLGSIDRGGARPAHVVINGENHHALEALKFTHAGKVDCIYIDPPYNSGARDWKYSNDYVDSEDAYRHSKWLAFMHRRLKLAKQLLNPDNSVLVCTIDEKECLRLGLLLEQVFPGCKVQMVTTVVSAKGTMRKREFSRVAEHIFVVLIGDASVISWGHNMLDGGTTEQAGEEVEWLQLRRREPSSTRASRPNQFFPIFVNEKDGTLHSIGDSVNIEKNRQTIAAPDGTIPFWPVNSRGNEMVWGLTPETLRERRESGYFRLRNWNPKKKTVSFQYLPSGLVDGIESGRIEMLGHEEDGSVRAAFGDDVKGAIPKTVWHMESHNAESYGTNLISRVLLPGRRFDYPKSLYAVEDTLRFFVKDNPDAIILDFFGGSGTTTHAVARLNHQDGGHRRSIVITNNEVSEDEAKALRKQGLQPGDPEWEALGIFEHITRPRITAAITGVTPEDDPVKGEYKFTDEFPMAEGFEENVEFFELTYLDEAQVEVDLAFAGIAPLLWLRAGARGPIIEKCHDDTGGGKPFALTEQYGVLFNTDRWRSFVKALPETATTVYIVTDSITEFSHIAGELSGNLDVVRLYERYLTTFAVNER
jgi:adenine-specific DNA-methyltransferase